MSDNGPSRTVSTKRLKSPVVALAVSKKGESMSTAPTTAPTRFPELDPERRYGMIIDGRSTQAADGAVFRCFDPYEEAEWGLRSRGVGAGRGSRRRGGTVSPARVGGDFSVPAPRAVPALGGARARKRLADRSHPGARERQDADGDDVGHGVDRQRHRILRALRHHAARRHGHPDDARPPGMDREGTRRCRRGHHPLEQPIGLLGWSCSPRWPSATP